jgi:hypothetical protein
VYEYNVSHSCAACLGYSGRSYWFHY